MKSIARWQPFQELNSLQKQMNRRFDNFFGRTTSLMPFEGNLSDWESSPPVDIYEDDQRLTLKVEVPGINEKDIKVEVENNVLTVWGTKTREGHQEGGELPPHGTSFRRILALFHASQHGGPGKDRGGLHARCAGNSNAQARRS
jgi:HSP20 family molecular chaperone IbpA